MVSIKPFATECCRACPLRRISIAAIPGRDCQIGLAFRPWAVRHKPQPDTTDVAKPWQLWCRTRAEQLSEESCRTGWFGPTPREPDTEGRQRGLSDAQTLARQARTPSLLGR